MLMKIVMPMIVQPMVVFEIGVDVDRRVLADFSVSVRMIVVGLAVAVPVSVKMNGILNEAQSSST